MTGGTIAVTSTDAMPTIRQIHVGMHIELYRDSLIRALLGSRAVSGAPKVILKSA